MLHVSGPLSTRNNQPTRPPSIQSSSHPGSQPATASQPSSQQTSKPASHHPSRHGTLHPTHWSMRSRRSLFVRWAVELLSCGVVGLLGCCWAVGLRGLLGVEPLCWAGLLCCWAAGLAVGLLGCRVVLLGRWVLCCWVKDKGFRVQGLVGLLG